MNILQVNNYGYVRGGSDACYLATQELLAGHGHTVSGFHVRNVGVANGGCLEQEFWPEPTNLEKPALADIMRFLYSRSAGKGMAGLCDQLKPDIAHLHIYYGQLTTAILHALKSRSIPVVQTLHEFKLVCPVSTLVSHGSICVECPKGGNWHAVARRCNQGSLARSALSAFETSLSRILGSWRHVDHFIAVSDFLRNKMIEFGLPADRITTVHNFIDATRFEVSTERGEYFLYLGRLEKIKGVMTLLEAMRRVPGTLLIAGDGSARHEMEDYIEKFGIRNVKMVGFKSREELAGLIKNSRCIVAPSEWYETFGLMVIEAFAHARPVIASRIGGLAEIVAEGVDGILVAPGNVEELSSALMRLLNDPGMAVEMGRRGREKVEMRFSAERHYGQLMAVYLNTISKACA